MLLIIQVELEMLEPRKAEAKDEWQRQAVISLRTELYMPCIVNGVAALAPSVNCIPGNQEVKAYIMQASNSSSIVLLLFHIGLVLGHIVQPNI